MSSLNKFRYNRILIIRCLHFTEKSSVVCRFQHVKVNHWVYADPRLKEGLESGVFKHKNHPGIMQLKKCYLPEHLEETMYMLAEKYPEDQLKTAAQKLYNYLWSRHLPPSDASIQTKAVVLESKLTKKIDNVESLTSEDKKQLADRTVDTELLKKLKRIVYHWQPIKYDVFRCFQYMTGRVPYDYSCLYRVLNEIKMRDSNFMPKTLLDFGSGLATSVWAANAIWNGSLHEHYCVDKSMDMNVLAQLLLQEGDEDKPMCYNHVYFRRFMPQSSKNQYDLVISAFSLMELATQTDRLELLMSLWKKTEKYLIILENGTNAGFDAISEARHFILQCPHDLPCPRVTTDKGTPCNFKITFKPFYKDFCHHGHRVKGENVEATFAYLVLKKGIRNSDEQPWSRIVREVHRHSKKVPLNTCSPEGHLEHTVITRKRHGADLYMCARKSNWGDLLPALKRDSLLSSDNDEDDDDDVDSE
ncbi:hypothetical protein LSH36_1383g00008 [Paralvinella palmiformis]|uniref:Methyltransferase-like protein 17, mitochondrial n=1 Tax=Paralvinella palmiformis TaxID=53620 RepID=A0AAD9IU61_9ANNE|nr:hypothetical protein LSH36_1383g00008 [Paralvinella palmiformis]